MLVLPPAARLLFPQPRLRNLYARIKSYHSRIERLELPRERERVRLLTMELHCPTCCILYEYVPELFHDRSFFGGEGPRNRCY